MKESKKQFIKKAHSAASSEWKEIIEKEFPKLFKKEEINGWYKDKEVGGWFVFLENGIVKHGFDGDGDWFYCHNQRFKLSYSDFKATDKEVLEALIKEAKKRGFKEGVRINNECIGYIYAGICNSNEIIFENGILSIDYVYIYKDGKWAEIIKDTITKEQAEKELGKTIIN